MSRISKGVLIGLVVDLFLMLAAFATWCSSKAIPLKKCMVKHWDWASAKLLLLAALTIWPVTLAVLCIPIVIAIYMLGKKR